MKAFVALLICALIAVGVYFGYKYFIDDKSDSSSSTSTSSQADTESGDGDDSTTSQNYNDSSKLIEITVSTDKYLYDGQTLDLEGAKKVISENSGKSVKLIDDNATENAFRDLKTYLEENKITIVE